MAAISWQKTRPGTGFTEVELKSYPAFFPVENRKMRSNHRHRQLGRKLLLFLPAAPRRSVSQRPPEKNTTVFRGCPSRNRKFESTPLQRRVSCEPDFYTDYFAFPSVSFLIWLPPLELPSIQKALVKCLLGCGPAVRDGPVGHRVPLPGGQRRAQPNHVTRRCDFPRLAQDALPGGRIGALDEWPAGEGARGRA